MHDYRKQEQGKLHERSYLAAFEKLQEMNSKYLLAHKKDSTLQYFPLKMKSKCRYAKKHCQLEKKMIRGASMFVVERNTRFSLAKGTRVAKLNEHLLCNFGANSKLWAAN